jgi:putative FmdB family regulatory protein
MPTYSYRCPKCEHTYDKFQKITDQTRATCPECATPGERVITGGAGVVFKGSGFYETDYKRAGEKKAPVPKPPEKKPDSASKKPDANKTGAES